MTLSRQRLLIFLVPLFLSLPFINRAYFVDDSYFVEIARWLMVHPAQPYDFRADDAHLQSRGWEQDGFVRMVNPLGHHYFLAGLIKLGGEREWFLRLGCVLLSCFSALFLFELARRWTQAPFLSAALILVTPVHWLSAHSLLIDSTLECLFLGGLFFYIRATEKDAPWLLVPSGIFMGLAILSKYTGLFVLPLTASWLFLRWKKINRHALFIVPWVIALLFLGAYSMMTAHLYGRPHILAASARMVHVFGWAKVLVFLVFFSGAALLPLAAWGAAGARERLFGGFFVFLLAVFFSSSLGGFSFVQGALMGLWLVTSFLFFRALLVRRDQWIYPRDHFIFIWLLGFIAMMLLVMDWVAARYYCLVIPAIGFATVRLLEMRWPDSFLPRLKTILAATFAFTLLLAYADYKQAEPSRLLGAQLRARGIQGGERHFYLGDSFTMGYLRAEGWIPCFPETTFQVGDLVLSKEVTMPLAWFAQRPIVLNQIAMFDFPTKFPLKVMDYQGSAGFYASVWGALPFTFSTGPWERFRLFEVTALRDNDSSPRRTVGR